MNDYALRFEDLHKRGRAIPIQEHRFGSSVPTQLFQSWKTSSLNLLEMVFGNSSTITIRFREMADDKGAGGSDYQRIFGLFEAAREEFSLGYIKGLRREIGEEFVADSCLRADDLLDEGYLQPAAVLVASALEDCFRSKAEENGVFKEGNGLTENINALKGAGVLSGATAKIVGGYPKFRNSAMHADWKSITESDVRGISAFLKAYVISK